MRGIRANIKRSNQETQQNQFNKEDEGLNSRGYYNIQNANEADNDYYQDHSQYYHRNPTLNNRDKELKPAESYRIENETTQKEARELVEKTKKMIDSLVSKQGEGRQSSTGKSKSIEKKVQQKIINYEDAIRIKSRSPSPHNETRGVMEKYNNSLLNSETNLKSTSHIF